MKLSHVESKIGFDKIRTLLQDRCATDSGKEKVSQIKFLQEPDQLNAILNQSAELKTVFEEGLLFPRKGFVDILAIHRRLSIDGVYLEEENFVDLLSFFRSADLLMDFFEDTDKEDFPELHRIVQDVEFDKSWIRYIEEIIDERGKVRNHASRELNDIRNDLIKVSGSLRSKMNKIASRSIKQKFTEEEHQPTIRNGRMVIPVKAEFKRRIQGLVHDESATGQTVYLEPSEVVEQNNQIIELENREKREIIRILTALTHRFQPLRPAIWKLRDILTDIDVLRAKTLLAIDMNAILPELKDKPIIDWQKARHPLLFLSFKDQDKKVVPLDIRLDGDTRLILISGPNAGGKSIALKTVGLIQYMLQCGILVPVEDGTICGIFKEILVSIGDDQSLENDLSTYSSHLTQMNHFLKRANPSSLVLIDEFGSGTDPDMGGAIAEAILEQLMQFKPHGVITTHFERLKHFAESHEDITNGAMLFDPVNLQPLFELETGKAGMSYALELASQIGLDKEVIARAKKLLGKDRVNYESLLQDLDKQHLALKNEQKSLANDKEMLSKARKEYEDLTNYLENRKSDLIKNAKKEAAETIRAANKEVENVIRTIKETKADKEATLEARRKVNKIREELENEVKSPKDEVEEEPQTSVADFKEGDEVRLRGSDTVGEILAIQGNEILLAMGSIRTKVEANRLVRSKGKKNKPAASSQKGVGQDRVQRKAEFNSTLDIRGERAEESIPHLDEYLNNALLSGMSEVRILHGKGNGVLREIVRNYLKELSYVAKFHSEHIERGGEGITVVQLK